MLSGKVPFGASPARRYHQKACGNDLNYTSLHFHIVTGTPELYGTCEEAQEADKDIGKITERMTKVKSNFCLKSKAV